MKHKYIPSIFFIAIFLSLFVVAASGQVSDEADPAKDFYRLTKAAPAAFNDGKHDRAIEMSKQLLAEAEAWKDNWNYGNAIHAANLVLGRVALARDEIDEAKIFLLAAGKTPGSPQLNSFGPDMLFASELLKKGERETVLEYFDLCAKFWKPRLARLEEWKAQVARGETPDFGANVRYFF